MAAKKSVVGQAPSMKKARKEEVEFINFEGVQEIKIVSTTCKIFGGCLYDSELNISCVNCKQSAEVKEACQIMTGTFLPVQKIDIAKKERSAGSGSGHGIGQYPPFIKIWQNGLGRGGMKGYVTNCIESEAYTKKEIISMTLNQFPDASSKVPGMYIGHGMKGKGKDAKRFPFKIVERTTETGKIVLAFDKDLPSGSWGQA